MSERTVKVDGVSVPRFLYGTAWKEDATQGLTELAIEQGFRGIDTANQRRHYFEEGVGEAVRACIARGTVRREDLFLQTKFTFRGGQDHRLPYDPDAPIAVQVEQSFASSLTHLGTNALDSYVLHGPSQRFGLGPTDWQAWRAMESLHTSGKVRLLGISNVTLEQLRLLHDQARVKPRFVQNRCFAADGWDHELRAFCSSHGIVYQGFSLLTANRRVLTSGEMNRLVAKYDKTVNQIVFRFALDVGMVPLTGTTDAAHMREDLDVFTFHLEPEDVAKMEAIAGYKPSAT